jgi:hypothetical protein
MLGRLARIWRRRAAAAVPFHATPPPPATTFHAELGAAGVSGAEWIRRRRQSAASYTAVSQDTIAALLDRHGDRAQQTIDVARRALRHEFELLGSGPYVPVDPDRRARDGYAPIDWHVDPLRQLRFTRTVPHKQWNLVAMQPGNADVKYPWELARCQHWAPLGQVFLFTDDDLFALEIARELDDFMEANPVGTGVNWACTMDVGLRAVSWTIGLALVRNSDALDDAFWLRAYDALFDHGTFIRHNLENTYEITSNHFLSNLLGLFFVGAVFADLPEGFEWTRFARRALEDEMSVQVLADGADYESSIPYHRLVTELFLGAVRLADRLGSPMSTKFRARVRDMIAYLAAVTRPDGLMPQVGDADDGRLHILGGYGTASPQDGRHLFGPSAMMFDEPAWLAMGGSAAAWEAAWWGFDVPRLPTTMQPPAPDAKLFRDSGVAVVRSGDRHFLLVTNGAVGTNGFGNHKHNDLLSFEYHHGGIPLVVDPGCYAYTSDADTRNRFRGTAYHNTVMVDGVEQNEIRPGYLFRLFEMSNPETLRFVDGDDFVEYVGRHHAYERLSEPLTHERTFRFMKSSGGLLIVDRLSGRGRHDVRWHFHLAPGVCAEAADSGVVALTAGARRWQLRTPPGLQIAVNAARYSPSYGVDVSCLAIDLSLQDDFSGERRFEFSIAP